MTTSLLRAFVPTAALLALLAACSDPPQPVDTRLAPSAEGLAGSRPADGVANPHGSPHGTGPAATGGGAEQGPMRFGGVALLHGALGEDTEGALFVSLRPEAGGMPLLSAKVELDNPQLDPPQDGVRRVPFLIDERHAMIAGGQLPQGNFRLEVRYDPDGIVDTRDGIVVELVTATRGAMDHAVELRPASGY
jgi:hypothetical protein